MMDTSAGPIPGFDPDAHGRGGRGRVHAGQGRAEGTARSRARCSRRPRTSGRSPSGPATRSSRIASGTISRRSCGARWRSSSRTSPTISPRSRPPCSSRCSCSSATQDTPFVAASQRDDRGDRRRAARRHSRRRALAAVREPRRVDRRADAVPRVACPRRPSNAVDAHGGRLAVEVLQRHDVDAMFTLSGGHLFVLYDGAVQADLRLVDVRHEQTATFAAEGWAKVTRRLGCAALDRGTGRDERRERDDRGADERFADGRARRPRAAGPLGRGLAAGARPRPDRRAGHEDGRDRDLGRVDRRRSRRRVPRRAHAAPRPDVRRHPARRVRARARSTFRRSSGDAFRGAAPDPDAIARVAELVGDVGAAGARRRRRRLLGARRGRDARVRRGRARAGVRQRHGPRHAARRPRARVLAGALGRAEGSRSRARRRDAARLPPRLRALRRRAGRAPRATPRARSRAHAALAASTAGDLAATFAALADGRRAARRARRLDRAAARRRAGEARGRTADARGRHRRRSSRRGSTASCASGSTATRS